LRSWLNSNWLELLISVLVAAVEVAILAPWLAVVLGWAERGSLDPAVPVGAGLIGLVSFWSGRIFLASGWDMAASRMLSLGIWLAMLVVWYGIVAGAGIAAPLTLIDQLVRFDGLAFGLLLLGGLAWWRGLWLASTDDIFTADFTRATTVRAVVSLGLMLVVLAFVSDTVAGRIFDVAVVAVPIGVVASLIAATAVQVRTARLQIREAPDQGRRGVGWLGAGASIALFVLVIAGLLAGTAGREVWARLIWPFELAARGLEFVLFWLLLALVYAMFMIIYPFLWLARRLISPADEAEPEPQEVAPPALPEFAEQTRDALPAFVGQALQVVVVLVLVSLVVWLALRSLRRYRALAGDEDEDEVRESVFSREAVLDDLGALFRSLRPRWAGRRRFRIDLNSPPASVRDAYRYTLVLAGRQGQPRQPRETPVDYAARLEAGDSALTEPLDDLTRRYLRERYGEVSDEADLTAARNDWAAIRQRLTDRG
jgi:hypothetical protein